MDEHLKQLEEKLKAAKEGKNALDKSMWAAKKVDDDKVAVLQAQLSKARMDRFSEKLKTTEYLLEKAREAYYTERLRVAKLGYGVPDGMKLGDVFEEWAQPRHAFGRGPIKKTGKRVVITVYETSTPIAENHGRMKPEPGDILAFYMKKDGTPSLRFEYAKWITNFRTRWLPEGVDPNVTETAA